VESSVLPKGQGRGRNHFDFGTSHLLPDPIYLYMSLTFGQKLNCIRCCCHSRCLQVQIPSMFTLTTYMDLTSAPPP
jgi:hypothetical protein